MTGAVVLPFRACRYFAPERGRIQDGADGGRGLRLQTAGQCHCLPHRLLVSIASVVFGMLSRVERVDREGCDGAWEGRAPSRPPSDGRMSGCPVVPMNDDPMQAHCKEMPRCFGPPLGTRASCPRWSRGSATFPHKGGAASNRAKHRSLPERGRPRPPTSRPLPNGTPIDLIPPLTLWG